MKHLRIVLLVCVMTGWAGSAQAVSIFLTGPTEAGVNQSFDIGFWLATPDQPILGGGAILTYDASLVSFDSFAFNPALACGVSCDANEIDPGFSNVPVDDGLGTLDFLAFGSFDGLDFAGGVQIGTFTFTGDAVGLADFGLDADTIAGWASGIAPFLGIDPADIDVAGLSVNIVPEPSIILLLSLGLLLIAARARRA